MDDVFDMTAARQLWAKKSATPQKAAREAKHRSLTDGVDRRSLRATGRTAQFNIRATPETIASAKEKARRFAFGTVAEFIEVAIAAYDGKGVRP
jgi:hypothetical protein